MEGLVSSLTSPCPGSAVTPALPSHFSALAPVEVPAPDKRQMLMLLWGAISSCSVLGGMALPTGVVGREHPSFKLQPPRLRAFLPPGWWGGAALGVGSSGC